MWCKIFIWNKETDSSHREIIADQTTECNVCAEINHNLKYLNKKCKWSDMHISSLYSLHSIYTDSVQIWNCNYYAENTLIFFCDDTEHVNAYMCKSCCKLSLSADFFMKCIIIKKVNNNICANCMYSEQKNWCKFEDKKNTASSNKYFIKYCTDMF